MATIHNVINEAKRGCGDRQPTGIYLVSEGLMMPCGKLPIPLDICPMCSTGIKFARSWTWINPRALFPVGLCRRQPDCAVCPAAHPPERAGLLWVGKRDYSTQSFTEEAAKLGVSRRIKSVPKDFKVGETFVFVAHLEAIPNGETPKPGIFHAFLPQRIEYILKGTETEDELTQLEKRGLTLINLVRTDGQPVAPLFEEEDENNAFQE